MALREVIPLCVGFMTPWWHERHVLGSSRQLDVLSDQFVHSPHTIMALSNGPHYLTRVVSIIAFAFKLTVFSFYTSRAMAVT